LSSADRSTKSTAPSSVPMSRVEYDTGAFGATDDVDDVDVVLVVP
jgi:hypothetical protein